MRFSTTPRTLKLAVGGAALGAAGLYALTLMPVISGCASDYCADVGEFQIALAAWGTVHFTGYPLYMLLGSPFVMVLRGLGVAPALAASAYSLVWETLAVALVAALAARLTQHAGLTLGAGLTWAVFRPIWVHGVIAEVYALSMVLLLAQLWLALDLREKWHDRTGWALALVAGLGVAHHRLLAVTTVVIGLWLLPTIWRQVKWRWLLGAALAFAAGFLPYLDLPLRAWLGSTWNYDQTGTWAGFWATFRGTEVAGLQNPSFELAALWQAARDIARVLWDELGALGAVVAGLSLVGAWRVRALRPATGLILAVSAGYGLFALFFRQAVLLEATLMPLFIGAVLSVAVAAAASPRWAALGTGVFLVWAVTLGGRNYPDMLALTQDRSSVAYTEQFEQLEAPPGAVVMAPWGAHYFALVYAQRFEGRFPNWVLVDHRADMAALAQAQGGDIYTAADTLYVFGLDWWAAHLGPNLRRTSAGPGLLALTAQPLTAATTTGVPLGDGLELVGWRVQDTPTGLLVTLEWAARQPPARDYSSFVHATDQPVIASPDDLIAQSDAAAPVAGWYPTTQWPLNEVVRDDHPLTFAPERPPTRLIVGLYAQTASGEFEHLRDVVLAHTPAGDWAMVP